MRFQKLEWVRLMSDVRYKEQSQDWKILERTMLDAEGFSS